MSAPPVILSIAGFDPSSGAGVTADIKTAAALGCYAVTCVTAMTVQSTQGVAALEAIRPGLVTDTLDALADDLPIAAVRLGMMGSAEVARAVADFLEARKLPNVVLDPVIRSTSGASLVDPAGLEVLRRRLIRLSDVITPNLAEAATLVGASPISVESRWEELLPRLRILAWTLHDLGSRAVIITGRTSGGALRPPELSGRRTAQRGDLSRQTDRVRLHPRHRMRLCHGDCMRPGQRGRPADSRDQRKGLRPLRDRRRVPVRKGDRAYQPSGGLQPINSVCVNSDCHSERSEVAPRPNAVEEPLYPQQASRRTANKPFTVSPSRASE